VRRLALLAGLAFAHGSAAAATPAPAASASPGAPQPAATPPPAATPSPGTPQPAAAASPETPETPPAEVSADEIAKALQADAAAKKKQQAAAGAASAGAPAAGKSSGGGWAAVARFVQSLNPDLSAIVDFTGGWFSNEDGTVKSGDDPAGTGFHAQEVEVAFSAVADPYLRADVYLTIPDLSAIEVEEAFLTTTHLPANFQLKVGVMRAQLGRQNTQHLHLQDFTRRPGVNPLFLGADGLRAPGLEINWLVPRIPFYFLLTFEMLSAAAAESDLPLSTFGGGQRWDFTYIANARAYWDLNEATSLYLGLSYAHGKTSQSATRNVSLPTGELARGVPARTAYDGQDSNLYGGDLYLKWKPPNQAHSWVSVAWQTEYFLRQIQDLVIVGAPRPQLEGGLYTQLVFQLHRRWYLGLRGEVLGLPEGDNVKQEYAAAGSITWGLSEFARVRLYGEARFPQAAGVPYSGAAFLQVEASIGAHGAHPF